LTREEMLKANRAARDRRVLAAAVTCAQRCGLFGMTRADIAVEAGVSVGTVSGAFDGMEALRERVLRHAITHETLPILADALANRHPVAQALPPELKARAVA